MTNSGIVITKTPFRISLFGGGSDIPAYFNEHEGIVIGFAVKQYLYVTLSSLERLFDKKIRFSYSKLETVDCHTQLEHPYARQALETNKNLHNGGFLDIHTFSDLPASSGVGSSSAFTVGFLNALYTINGNYICSNDLARKAIKLEREDLNEAGGWQDQIWAAFGGFNRIDFSKQEFRISPMSVKRETYKLLENSLVIFFTSLTRSSSHIQKKSDVSQYKKNQILSKMVELSYQADQLIRTYTNNTTQFLTNLGSLLHQSWELKKQLSGDVSTNSIDDLYNKGLENGALGGKLCGAGGGGFILFLVEPKKRQHLIESLSEYKSLPVEIEDSGSHVIYSKFVN